MQVESARNPTSSGPRANASETEEQLRRKTIEVEKLQQIVKDYYLENTVSHLSLVPLHSRLKVAL